jgi:Rhodopirellula transposase DDE domain
MSPLGRTSKSIRALSAALRENGHLVSDLWSVGCCVSEAKACRPTSRRPGALSMRTATPSSSISTIRPKPTWRPGPGDQCRHQEEGAGRTYKNGGRQWQPKGEPEQVNVHDFIDPTLGKANPYGVYDSGANIGWVSVCPDHDTAVFAVNAIRTWWHQAGNTL